MELDSKYAWMDKTDKRNRSKESLGSSKSPGRSRSGSRDKMSFDEDELKRQLAAVRRRLAMYEGENQDRQAQNTEEQKKRVKKMFDVFDRDMSGDINAEEFQDLSYQLGETLTKEEVIEYIRQIDTNGDGKVDFEEFFIWWSSIDQDAIDTKQEKMNVLKMKLTSKAYIRAISGFSGKLQRAKQRTRSFSEDDATAKLKIDVTVGTFETKASIDLQYTKDAKQAKEHRDQIEISNRNSLIVSFAFGIAPGVDEKGLNEFSRNINTLLTLAKKELHFSQFVTRVVEENGLKLYAASVIFDEHEMGTSISEALESLQIKTLSANLQINSAPSRVSEDKLPLRMKLLAKAELPRASVEVLHSIIGEEEEEEPPEDKNTQESEENPSGKLPSKKKGFKKILYAVLKALMNLSLTAKFSDLGSFLHALGSWNSKIPDLNYGWEILREYIRPIVKDIITDPEISPATIDAYFNLLDTIGGVHSITVQIRDYVVCIKTHELSLVNLLPSKDELEAEEIASGESDNE